MPQLDIFWWGFNFFLCWTFFVFLYIYLSNLKFFLGSGFGFSFKSISKVIKLWLW